MKVHVFGGELNISSVWKWRGRLDLKSGLWFAPPMFIKRDVKRVTSHTRPFLSLCNNGRALGTRLLYVVPAFSPENANQVVRGRGHTL